MCHCCKVGMAQGGELQTHHPSKQFYVLETLSLYGAENVVNFGCDYVKMWTPRKVVVTLENYVASQPNDNQNTMLQYFRADNAVLSHCSYVKMQGTRKVAIT